MAGIDKTYTDSYKDYKEFKDWSNKQTLTFYNGYKVNIGNWVWEWEEEDFTGEELPIMNTPTWLDMFLVQNCKSDFVLDRMKVVYGEEAYNNFKTVDLTAKPPSEYQQNRKIVITKTKRTKFSLRKKPLDNNTKWWLQCDADFWYDDVSRTWADSRYYPTNTNTVCIKTVKGVIRHLRKQYLPKNITFRLSGRYVGEDYLITIK